MLDIKFIRENKDLIKEAARKKHVKVDIDRISAIDEKRRALIQEVDALRQEHKKFTGVSDEAKISKDKISHKEFELKAVEDEFNELMLQVPNVPDPSVPEGESDAENQEIRKVREPKKFSGQDYLSIMKRLDMVDLERGVKVSGFRGYFLKNEGALLSLALWHFVFDFLVKKGFAPFLAPVLIRRENMVGTGWFPQVEEDIYKTQDDLYLSGTAEVPMMGYHADEILKEEDLPKKYVAFSPCYRREVGSYGKDTKGIFRVHEFYKIEQVVLCRADHQESVKWHEELTKNSEEIMQALEIPYRVVINCGGDLGLGQVKKYDIEGWIPSEGRYRETHSASYFHDFQARRLNIKYKDNAGKIHFIHSLNNTAIATPRILEAFLENNLREDGSIKIPEALQKYYGARGLL
ncbi:MAG: serine--tRNA ligase [Candidatus Nealsonbacteria bacterium RIFCSPLOWO2_02_39_8]|uniref:Serine--tRNA ligase n=3 Tax=Parcubacteria group TaxID=1794811 RepID=A0A1G2EGC7_9BACT|nr:MAG: Serine-tRNA ligase [Candidatus Giovannonibacteria bacterium GW2011_GWB1_43_13]KKS99339.1 MAG: Serine-tRNA ligase [Candidatus Giovannonibacteria bacterium GW2011_GWA1_43_15]KKT21717.1 MAG: Serine-tRNA ligase [Candidatus Giovannonibacteria bacterium GW2011_GWC2_43_8]KKT63313.1 MAG: Serine-tRNA ligase [Candidatus Giovannonibacteria bacterium GW2011_GWA2_44_26]OGF59239.1 MAG: serine--tRNA ligase [Candidatus Giovannonibacteria bacterium RIFCSPHIGHO2_01_FULL_43_140]OGF70816.1 MAG: serine--tR